ncbi:MAG: nitrous oxide reductase accessory protein NosL [Acidobacteria bacterium]|nr:nitrous oxide reductase accessory protein NosL [Acidobacteriota bacterium]
MSRKSIILGVVILLAAGLGAGYLGWKAYVTPQACDGCGRPLHAQTRTVALVGGEREVFCCPACALSEHRQTGKAVDIVELSDYETATPMAPGNSYVVRGSDENFCMHEHPLVEEHKGVIPMEFDRCAPSIMAFARKEAAEQFSREHGGTVLRFEDLAPAYQR